MSATHALTDLAAGLLVDGALKSTALLAAGGLAAWLLRHRPAAERHAALAATLATLPLVPLVTFGARGGDVALTVPYASGLLALWITGAAAALVPLGAGYLGLRAATARGRDQGRDGRARLVASDEIALPLTFGWLRPVVLLPAEATRWSSEVHAAVSAHERAHVDRADWLVHVLARSACAVLWFHPLVWWVARELDTAAEEAADDAALQTGIAASTYATALLALGPGRTRAAALSARGRSCLSRRVRAVLRSERATGAARWTVGTLVAAALIAATLPLAQAAAWRAQPAAATAHCNPDTPPPLYP